MLLFGSNRESWERRGEAGLQDLRGEALLLLIGATFAYACYLTAFVLDGFRWGTWIAPLWLLILVGASFQLRQHQKLSASVLTFGLLLVVTIEAMVVEHSLTPCYFFTPIVGVAAILLGSREGGIVALLASGVVALQQWLAVPNSSDPQAVILLFLIWSSAFLFWVIHRSLYTALDWSWNSLRQAQAKTTELQIRQGELIRTLKSLNETYDRLEKLNVELSYARQSAEYARRQKAEFTANVSHELRTPLNLVIGFTEAMIMAPESYGNQPLPPAYRTDLDAVYRNACHLSSLVDDILDLSRIEAGHMSLTRDRIEFGQIVEDAVKLASGLFEAKGLYLRIELPRDLPSISVDSLRIRQVLINLLSNAARFTSRGGVVVRAATDKHDLVVSVADTGSGIAAEDLPRMFEEFHQLDGPPYGQHGGTGLGLSICKRFVELHGGSIWVESRLGEGTTFHFTIPLVDNVIANLFSGEQAIWDRLAGSGRSRQGVVVVADDRATIRVFQRYLHGYDVVGAQSVTDVRQRLSEEPVCGVIVATSSPEQAREKLSELTLDFPNVRSLVCSLTGSHEVPPDPRAARILSKPITRANLHRALEGIRSRIQHVLIIDADADEVQMLSRMLKSRLRRCRIRCAYSGSEAIDMLTTWEPDIIILDLDLKVPELSGATILDFVKSDYRLADTPVVLITTPKFDDELIQADFVGISHSGGMSVGELARCAEITFTPGRKLPSNGDPKLSEAPAG